MSKQPPLLELVDIHYTLAGQKSPIFNGLQLTVNHGERIAIIAGEAEGKSTLIRLLAGLITPFSGDILLSGVQLKSPPPQPGGIGLLFLDTANHFLTPVVQEEVMLSMGNSNNQELEKKVAYYLELAGLPSKIATSSLVKLSTSQQYRVAVAALLASQSRIILADEPGIFLDLNGEQHLAKIFKELAHNKKTTQVIFTSRMDRAKGFAERILFLNKGILSNTPSPMGRF
ncbi:MAG: ABC transporter ATP-binding protein [Magnetococcales bacterium]|nr:ABC transporter ATP-binding protein [Magnetococcales bacterium]